MSIKDNLVRFGSDIFYDKPTERDFIEEIIAEVKAVENPYSNSNDECRLDPVGDIARKEGFESARKSIIEKLEGKKGVIPTPEQEDGKKVEPK